MPRWVYKRRPVNQLMNSQYIIVYNKVTKYGLPSSFLTKQEEWDNCYSTVPPLSTQRDAQWHGWHLGPCREREEVSHKLTGSSLVTQRVYKRATACYWLGMGGGGGAGIAQWLEHRTRDWKVTGSNTCWNGGRIFFSRVDFLCWLLFRYPFHPRVTTVARKKIPGILPKVQVAGYS